MRFYHIILSISLNYNIICFPFSDAIENNVEKATGSVEDGLVQLNEAARNQAKYHKKVMLLLLIAIILGLVVTGIIVSSLRS